MAPLASPWLRLWVQVNSSSALLPLIRRRCNIHYKSCRVAPAQVRGDGHWRSLVARP